jgi:hypothetical protein
VYCAAAVVLKIRSCYIAGFKLELLLPCFLIIGIAGLYFHAWLVKVFLK